MSDHSICNKLTKPLPDGTNLVAEIWNEPGYPGIRISLQKSDGTDEVICFAEFCTNKPKGRQLCVCVYSSENDEPAYYESYADPQPPSHNT